MRFCPPYQFDVSVNNSAAKEDREKKGKNDSANVVSCIRKNKFYAC